MNGLTTKSKCIDNRVHREFEAVNGDLADRSTLSGDQSDPVRHNTASGGNTDGFDKSVLGSLESTGAFNSRNWTPFSSAFSTSSRLAGMSVRPR